MNNAQYRVFPEQPNYKIVGLGESDKQFLRKSNSSGTGGSLVISVVIAVISLFVVFPIWFGILQSSAKSGQITERNTDPATLIIMMILPPFIISPLIGLVSFIFLKILKNKSAENKAKAEITRRESELNHRTHQAEFARVTREADSLTQNAANIYDSSLKISSLLAKNLGEAQLWLEQAEHEYNANAFAPYWEALEEAATWLGNFNDGANQLTQNANSYYQMLNRKNHTFPVFPVQLQTIPDPSFVINELYRVGRLGQTNFHFANIGEHRKTRRAIIAGFQNLNDAVNNLGDTIEYSISNLQNSISSDMARVVEEQIRTRESVDRTRESVDRTRESIDKSHQTIDKRSAKIDKRLLEQNRMLDNIQHDREPKIKDIPTKY